MKGSGGMLGSMGRWARKLFRQKQLEKKPAKTKLEEPSKDDSAEKAPEPIRGGAGPSGRIAPRRRTRSLYSRRSLRRNGMVTISGWKSRHDLRCQQIMGCDLTKAYGLKTK